VTNKKLIVLLGIILIASFLRFYKLGHNAASLTWDEVAWGYNAYSLGIDGRDEFGRFLPIDYLESFGDFKPPVYAYLAIIPVKIFGLNEFAVRVPSAFFGVLTVVVTYFLTKRIFLVNSKSEIRNPKQIQNSNDQNSKHSLEIRNWKLEIPIIAAAILAISPWHINLSRGAFEANVATFFIILGVFLFLHAVSRGATSFSPQGWNYIGTLVIAAISFALSMYTFNTARVVVPLLVVILSIGFWKRLWGMKKEVVMVLIVGSIVMLPLLRFLLYPQASLRFREVNIFSDIGVIYRTNQEMANDENTWWSRILHNRRFAYSVEYLKHYFDNLSPQFLFIKGDGNPKFSTQDVGSMYLWDLPFFVLGILFVFRHKIGRWWIVPAWMIIGIIPAATARETPHALRIETALPTFQIFVAYGLFIVMKGIFNFQFSIFNKRLKHFKFLIVIFIFSLLFFNFVYYIHGYYVHYPREYSGEWQHGYKDAISYVKSVEGQYDRIYFTESLGRPYIYFLFYTQYEPKKFRQEALVEREVFGFVHVNGFDKYRFTRDIKSNAGQSEKVLYVDTPANVPENAQILKNFYLLNGEKTLAAYAL